MLMRLGLTLVLLAQSAIAEMAEAPATLAVVDFAGYERYGLHKKVPDLLTDELVGTGRFVMVERARLDQILAEQGLQNSGLVSQNPVELGALLGADFLVTGSVLNAGTSSKTFSGYGATTRTSNHNVKIGVRVLDVKTGRIVFSTKKSASSTSYDSIALRGGGNYFDALAQQAVQKVARAMRVNPNLNKPSPGTSQLTTTAVTITSEPPGADVEVDGVFYGNAGGDFELRPGLHTIKVSLPGYTVWEKKVMVQEASAFNVRLQPEPVRRLETLEQVDIRVQQVPPPN